MLGCSSASSTVSSCFSPQQRIYTILSPSSLPSNKHLLALILCIHLIPNVELDLAQRHNQIHDAFLDGVNREHILHDIFDGFSVCLLRGLFHPADSLLEHLQVDPVHPSVLRLMSQLLRSLISITG